MTDNFMHYEKVDWDEYSPILKICTEQMLSHPEWAKPMLNMIFRQIAESALDSRDRPHE